VRNLEEGDAFSQAVRVRLLGSAVTACVALALPAGGAAGQIVATRAVPASMAVDGAGRAFLVTGGRVRSAATGARFGSARTVVRASGGDRIVDAGVAAGGSGVIFVQDADHEVLAASFGAHGKARTPVVVSEGTADFAASGVAPSGAAIVVWFRHREDRRWRLEASVREHGGAAFGPAEPLSGFVRRACCTNVSAAIGSRGDAIVTWSSTARASVWAALRRPGQSFHRARRLVAVAADAPRAFVGAGGAAAVIYSTQHVPRAAADGLQLRRSTSGGRFGPAEHVNPGGGLTIADVAITPSGDVSVAWADQVHGANVHLSEAAAGGPLCPTAELGTNAAPRRLALAVDDGRAAVAWSERGASGRRERVVGATRPARAAPFGPPAALGRRWRAAEPELVRLVPGGGALVLWTGSRYGPPAARRTALAVTRLA
jgi:hypothetical protein